MKTETTRELRRPGGIVWLALTIALVAVLGAGGAPAGAVSGIAVDGDLSDWVTIFNADGSVRRDAGGVPEFISLYGGSDANFVWDDVYTATNQETTALFAGAQRPVDRGVIAAEYDVKRSYFYVEPDDGGSDVYYVGIERASAGGDGSIEIEFNQRLHRLGHGRPWQLRGKRSADDFLARVDIVAGAVSAVTLQRANRDPVDGSLSWETVASLAGEGCDGFALCLSTNAATIAGGGPWSGYDESNPEAPGPGEDLPPGTFLELSVNLGAVLGQNIGFASACVITPMDVAFAYFGEGDWEN